MLETKMPMQAKLRNMELCPKFNELDRFSPIQLMLISQIIPFMFIVAKRKLPSIDSKESAFYYQQTSRKSRLFHPDHVIRIT